MARRVIPLKFPGMLPRPPSPARVVGQSAASCRQRHVFLVPSAGTMAGRAPSFFTGDPARYLPVPKRRYEGCCLLVWRNLNNHIAKFYPRLWLKLPIKWNTGKHPWPWVPSAATGHTKSSVFSIFVNEPRPGVGVDTISIYVFFHDTYSKRRLCNPREALFLTRDVKAQKYQWKR